MANRTFFDFGAHLGAIDDLLKQRILDDRMFSSLFGQMSASGATFTVPFNIGGQPIPTPASVGVSPVATANFKGFHVPTQNTSKILSWLLMVAAPTGCPQCGNDHKGAWTVAANPLMAEHAVVCDNCGWQHTVTSELVADFVMGRPDDPRDYDTCACGQRKRKLHPRCTACVDAAKWDTCSCGAKKLKAFSVCSDCLRVEADFDCKVLAVEHGGLIECR